MKLCQILLTIGAFVTLAPVIVCSLLLLYIYRRIVDTVLRIQLKHKFAGLLDGSDCVWAVEQPAALSVINVLVILDKDARHSNTNFLEHFREIVHDRILDSPFEKLFYTRRKKYGYFFWERSEEVNLQDRVRWLEYERTNCDGSCDNIYNGHLKRVLRNVCNQPLPEDHTASWEILIGKSCPRSSYHYLRRMEERLKNGRIRIPILFRVHHSLADGVDLLRLLLETVVDRDPNQEMFLKVKGTNFTIDYEEGCETISVAVPQLDRLNTCLRIEDMQYSCQKDILSASMPFSHVKLLTQAGKSLVRYLDVGLKYFKQFTLEEVAREIMIIVGQRWKGAMMLLLRGVYGRIEMLLRAAMILFATPACLVQQALRIDESALHGPVLSGDKVISYWLEDDFRNSNEQKLLTKVQSIKCITGAKFGDVILAALSASLHKHFLKMDEAAPNNLTVILPARMVELEENVTLKNSFSVGLLPVCISAVNGQRTPDPTEDSKVLERLRDIQTANSELRQSHDYMINFLIMKYLSAVLPERFLRPILESHSTMVFSNLPGPREVRILGHPLKNIAFWIPNRSNTGIGFSLLSYRGYLHLSLVADKSLVKDEKHLTEILENTVHEIDDLYDRLTLSSLSRRFHGGGSTPTKKEIGVL